MEPIYCLIHRFGEVPDLWLLEAQTEAEAVDEIGRREQEWSPFAKAELFRGERRLGMFLQSHLEAVL